MIYSLNLRIWTTNPNCNLNECWSIVLFFHYSSTYSYYYFPFFVVKQCNLWTSCSVQCAVCSHNIEINFIHDSKMKNEFNEPFCMFVEKFLIWKYRNHSRMNNDIGNSQNIMCANIYLHTYDYQIIFGFSSILYILRALKIINTFFLPFFCVYYWFVFACFCLICFQMFSTPNIPDEWKYAHFRRAHKIHKTLILPLTNSSF